MSARRERAPAPEDLPRMTLLEHLEELRRRIFRALLAVGAAFALCFAFAGQIFDFLARPIYRYLPAGTRLAYLGITDPFVLYMKVALLAGVFLAAPVVLLEVWRFVAPRRRPSACGAYNESFASAGSSLCCCCEKSARSM